MHLRGNFTRVICSPYRFAVPQFPPSSPPSQGLDKLLGWQELEYPEGHTSRSIYVAMPIVGLPGGLPREAARELEGAALAVWTTTPWTMPANMAVAVNAELTYCVVQPEVFLTPPPSPPLPPPSPPPLPPPTQVVCVYTIAEVEKSGWGERELG